MATTSDDVPEDALEDVAYLSRSDNRVRVLEALAAGAHTRRELEDVTGVSRATLGRIINEFEDRDWAERTTDGDYAATPTGRHVAAQFGPFVESIAAVRRLGAAVEWLPADELSIGLHHFSDASVKRPANDDPMAVIDYFTDLVRNAAEFRTLTHLAPPVAVGTIVHERILEDRLTATCVLTADLVDYLRERPDRRERWRGTLEGGAAVYRYADAVPCNLFVIDDTVLVKQRRPGSGANTYAVPIVSDDDAVRSWAHELIDTYRDDADRLPVETFAGEPSASAN